MTPDLAVIVPEVPNQSDERRRAIQTAFLREKFPHGVQPHQYADMLYALEIAQAIYPVVVRAVSTRPPVRTPPASPPSEAELKTPRPRPSPPKSEEVPLSKGAKSLIKLIEETPRISIEKLASALGYKQGYIQQLVGEARRSGTIIDTIIDPKTKSPRYTIVTAPMHETDADKPDGETTH